MENYDLIDAMKSHSSFEFDARDVAKSLVKQMHLMLTKLHMIRDASHSMEKREIIQRSCDQLQEMIQQIQSGDLDRAIRNADRSTMLCADVELARESVALVVAASTDPNKAFWLVGQGVQHRIDLSDVLKK